MLLRNVLAGFLDNLPNERALDLPLLALLLDMGFEDIHFTHGPAEFGKDFIAKRRDDGELTQYSFQSKAGNISQGVWRSEVMPQMLEAVTVGLSHPRFDKGLPHQAVLVTSGRLSGNAALGAQEFNEAIQRDYRKRAIDVWDRDRLIEHFIAFGPDAFYVQDDGGVEGYGAFLTCYGKALRGELLADEIERHSRYWLGAPQANLRMFEGALEAELLSTACTRADRHYEAYFCLLAHLRATLVAIYSEDSEAERACSELKELYSATVARVVQLARTHFEQIMTIRDAGDSVFEAVNGAVILTYPVTCMRANETAGVVYFAGDGADRERALRSLEMLHQEEGAAHPLSDRAAVSLVVATLALAASGRTAAARDLVRRAAVWVADRYDNGAGLAEFDASPVREAEYLLGDPFEGVSVVKRRDSLLASALCDLAAFLGEAEFFVDVVNEFLTVGVAFAYFQPRDTVGQFVIHGEDVVQYPNVEFTENIAAFDSVSYANHITSEEPAFRLAGELGSIAYVGLMLLLRDRYFPTVWPLLNLAV